MKLTALLLLFVTALGLIGCGSGSGDAAGTTGGNAPAADKKAAFKDVVMYEDEDSKAPKTSFVKDTPMIHVSAGLANMPNGSKIKGVWIGEKTDKAPPETKIDEATVEVAPTVNVAHFSLSKPTAGWPLGDYRVELYFNDTLLDTVKFKVE